MAETFVLHNGTVLELQPPNADAIRTMIAGTELSVVVDAVDKAGQSEAAEAIKSLEGSLSTDQMLGVSNATDRLFNYCVGWGVRTNPPQADLRELEALGFDASTERVARVNWLRYVKLEDVDEASALMGRIMALAFEAEGRRREEKERAKALAEVPLSSGDGSGRDGATIEALRARITELEAQGAGAREIEKPFEP
jgi:hypothetical protein